MNAFFKKNLYHASGLSLYPSKTSAKFSFPIFRGHITVARNGSVNWIRQMWCVARFGTIVCNFTKVYTPSQIFFTFFKLYKWYQTAQCTTSVLLFWLIAVSGKGRKPNVESHVVIFPRFLKIDLQIPNINFNIFKLI